MKLIVEPRVSMTRKEFIETTPHGSIALDGYVLDWPKFNHVTKHINFDHHTDVERLATRSTMGQVLIAIKQKLFDCIDYDTSGMYVNDADQDVCLSTWLLKNYKVVEWSYTPPLLAKLLDMQDKLDCTSGLYAINPISEIIETAAWIFDPYAKARAINMLYDMDADQMSSLIDTIHGRVDAYLAWNAQRKKLEVDYKLIWGWKNRSMVEEIGYDARIKMAYDGIKSFVSVKELGNGKYVYSVGKLSQYIQFSLSQIFESLNFAEWIDPKNTDRRNGWTTIWGSPRERKSYLNPKEVEWVINKLLESSAT